MNYQIFDLLYGLSSVPFLHPNYIQINLGSLNIFWYPVYNTYKLNNWPWTLKDYSYVSEEVYILFVLFDHLYYMNPLLVFSLSSSLKLGRAKCWPWFIPLRGCSPSHNLSSLSNLLLYFRTLIFWRYEELNFMLSESGTRFSAWHLPFPNIVLLVNIKLNYS